MTPAQLAEQAGSMEAVRMLEAMKSAPTQGERLAILEAGLREAATPEAPPEVLAGFACALVGWLDLAMGIK